MKRIETGIRDLAVIEPVVFGDERGYFYESYNARSMAAVGIDARFVQDNQSRSRKGILRGLHYQVAGTTQDKLIRCLYGAIFDVAVDLRRGSPTFGRWFGIELTGENKKMLWVPKGFAHGFLTLSDMADVGYKVTDYWSKNDERGVRWSGAGIAWPDVGVTPDLNARDAGFPNFDDIPDCDLFEYTP